MAAADSESQSRPIQTAHEGSCHSQARHTSTSLDVHQKVTSVHSDVGLCSCLAGVNAGGGGTAQVSIGLGHHVKQFGQNVGWKVEPAFHEVLMHVFDDLVAFEVVGGHQSIEMAHGTVQHAGVLRTLLFPAPIMQSPPQGFLDDHAHLDDFRLLEQAPQCVAVGV